MIWIENNMESRQFQIPSRDGRAQLTGQVKFPSNGEGAARHPFVLMVPCGWFMDRDGHMGNSGTERDLVYRDLAHDLLAAGRAVVRYDNRGGAVQRDDHAALPTRRRQQAFGEERIQAGIFAQPPRLVLHEGREHSLRTDEPAAGPMDEAAKACLVGEVRKLLSSPAIELE